MIFNQELCEVGKRIRERREEMNMTASDLAVQINVTPATISSIENGQSAAKISVFIAIAKALKVSFDHFQPQELDQYLAVSKELTEVSSALKSKSLLEQKIIMNAISGMVYTK